MKITMTKICSKGQHCTGEASGQASVNVWGSFSALEFCNNLWSQKLGRHVHHACNEWCLNILGDQEGVENDPTFQYVLILSQTSNLDSSIFKDFLIFFVF